MAGATVPSGIALSKTGQLSWPEGWFETDSLPFDQLPGTALLIALGLANLLAMLLGALFSLTPHREISFRNPKKNRLEDRLPVFPDCTGQRSPFAHTLFRPEPEAAESVVLNAEVVAMCQTLSAGRGPAEHHFMCEHRGGCVFQHCRLQSGFQRHTEPD